MEENQCRKISKNHAIILDGFLCSKSTPLPILPNVKRLRIERFRDDWMRGLLCIQIALGAQSFKCSNQKRRYVMCFRPAEISGPKECPACGKIIPVIPGMPLPEKCSDCGADLSSLSSGTASSPSAPSSAPTPSAPKAPGAPIAPGAPKPPSVH